MPRMKIVTLGCKVNRYESQYLTEGLARLGYRRAGKDEPADLIIVNTCTITAESDSKSRKIIRRLHRDHPGAELIVTGCYATREPETLAELPGVSELIRDKADLPRFLETRGLPSPPEGIEAFGTRHRAFVKVQDGCNAFCAYCIIPSVRPVLRSRPVAEVVTEVRRLIAGGFREIVLTGIHLGFYGVDLEAEDPRGNRPDLARLVERLLELEARFRLRLSSLEAAELSDALLSLMAEHPDRICPHLHLPLQSGSDAVLAAMGRRQTSNVFLRICRKVRETLPSPALSTDVIVGFPGETEADFEATCRLVERIGFSKVHVFRFSPRDGTRAAAMTPRVTDKIVHDRATRLIAISERLREEYVRSRVGERSEALLEVPLRKKGNESSRADEGTSLLQGTTERYLRIVVESETARCGDLVPVEADRSEGEMLRGHLAE